MKLYGLLINRYLRSRHFLKVRYLRLKGAKIGHNTWIFPNLAKQAGADLTKIRIGDRCVICSDTLLLSDESYSRLLKGVRAQENTTAGITIKDNCFIGIGAVILNGVTIGPNAIIGAGSVVMADVEPNTCVAGNPARHLCGMEAYAAICSKSLIEGYKQIKANKIPKRELLEAHFWQ